MAKMTVKEHDVINFSIKVKVGARRCYEKEIFQIGDVLFVLVDGRCVPLSDVYHIEKIGRNLNCKNEITYTTEIKQLTKERDEYKNLYETMYRKYSNLQEKELNCEILRKERSEYLNKAVELQKQVDELKEDIAEKDSVIDNLIKERPSIEKYAVKDTANKVYKGLCIYKNFCKMKDSILWGNESEELKSLISKIVGVEVE